MSYLNIIINLIPSNQRQALASWWDKRAPREKKILIIGVYLLFAILFFSAISAWWQAEQAIQKSIPTLRINVAKSNYYAGIWESTKPRKKMPLLRTLLRANAAFASEGFLVMQQKINSTTKDLDTIQVNIENANMASFLRWSNMLEADLGLTLSSVQLTTDNNKKLSGSVVVSQNQ